MTTKVRMLQSTLASPDGIKLKNYVSGRIYEINDDLLMSFVSQGIIEIVDSPDETEFDPIISPENRMTSPEPRGRRSR